MGKFMAIQIPNLGSGNGLTGDNELVIRQKYNANFTDQANAASRLVGTEPEQLPRAVDARKAFANVNITEAVPAGYNMNSITAGEYLFYDREVSTVNAPPINYGGVYAVRNFGGNGQLTVIGHDYVTGGIITRGKNNNNWSAWALHYNSLNTTKDANGFLKGASPVVDLYDAEIEQNEDAKKQKITFEKVATGDYLIKGSLGLAQEGWYIETPKDANGNVLVAVVYKQLANNDLSIKTYAKKFDDETGDIVANLTKPRDIPTGRFISLRLHELPTEPTPPME